MTDDIARELGFADADEFFRLTAAPDLYAPGAIAKFKDWQTNDGTKSGLITVFPELEKL